MPEIDLGTIIDTIVAFNFNDYVLGPDSYLELSPLDPRGNVREWVIDLAIEVAEALEPGIMHSASVAGVPGDDSAAAAMSHMHERFVRGVQEARRDGV